MENDIKSNDSSRNIGNWFLKHVDTLAVIATVLSGFLWINGKFNDIEKDIAVIKTVMIMKNIVGPDVLSKACKKEVSE